MPHKVKIEAKEVSEAIEKGLKKMGLRRDQVEVTVLENPRKGFLGIGARPAVVELRQKRWVSDNLDAQIYMDVPKKKRSPVRGRGGRGAARGRKHEESAMREIKHGGRRSYASRRPAAAEKAPKANETQLLPCDAIRNAVVPEFLQAPLQEAKEFLSNVLTHMGVKTENLNAWWDEKQHRILLTFDCDHPAIVIGKEGKTLESLQYLATLSLSRHFDKPISVIADTQNYWRKAEDKINADLEFGINQIKKGYSVYRFRPMSAQLRRYIHRAAENNEFVITVSEGEGQWRKVTLRPRPADRPVNKEPSVAEAASAAKDEVCASAVQGAAVVETVKEEPAAPAENTAVLQSCSCQNEPCRCAEEQHVCSCGCEQTEQTQSAVCQEQSKVISSEKVQGDVCPEPISQEQSAPAVQDVPVQTQETAPAAETPQEEPAVPAAPVAQDNAQGGTCQAEMARNCAEGEQSSGCACGPLFESVPAEENNPQK